MFVVGLILSVVLCMGVYVSLSVCPSVTKLSDSIQVQITMFQFRGGRACSTRTADFLLSPSMKLGMLRLCNRSCLLSTNAVLWVLSDVKSGVILCICPVTDISATR